MLEILPREYHFPLYCRIGMFLQTPWTYYYTGRSLAGGSRFESNCSAPGDSHILPGCDRPGFPHCTNEHYRDKAIELMPDELDELETFIVRRVLSDPVWRARLAKRPYATLRARDRTQHGHAL